MKILKQHAAVKSIGGIVLLLLVVFAAVSVIGYSSFTEALLARYSEDAFLIAETAARTLDADRMNEYAESEGATQEYLDVQEQLDRLCNTSRSAFIYVIQPDRSDYAHITFLFSVIGHERTYTKYDFGYVRDTTNDEYRQKYRALYDLEAERELVIRDRGYIETDAHITAMVGLKGSDGQVKAILCVQRQMDVLSRERQWYINRMILILVILAVLVIAGQSLFLHRTLLQPLKMISDEAGRFSKESVKSEKKLQDRIRNQDEIGHLAASIDQMEEQIQDYVASITKITAEKERISTEMNLARKIQASALPSDFPERREFSLYASMTPAKEVGGDFYDFFMTDDDHLALVIADVAGKGIPAAMFMMTAKTLIKNKLMTGCDPAAALEYTNIRLCEGNSSMMFVTVWLAVLEISTGKGMACNAGHEHPGLKRADGKFGLVMYDHDGVVGPLKKTHYHNREFELHPGDTVFVYTSGIPEAVNADEAAFGNERIIDALNRHADADPEELIRSVCGALNQFMDGTEQFDDMTMLCLRYYGTEK